MDNWCVGDFVRFKKEFWQEKKNIASKGGLFGGPLPENAENLFKISSVNVQDEDSVEIFLSSYPWAVYADELEMVKIQKIAPIVLVKFSQEYYSQRHSTYKNLRFGQAFLNKFYPDIPEYTDIYYGEDDEKVVSLIIEHFVELERETLPDILWK